MKNIIVHKKKELGFTLIELLITILILGILTSFIYPRIFGITKQAEETSLLNTASSLKKSIELCISETDTMPKSNDNNLNFENSSVDFNLTDNYEIEGLNSYNSVNKTYELYLYELNNKGNRTGKYAIISEDKIIITQ